MAKDPVNNVRSQTVRRVGIGNDVNGPSDEFVTPVTIVANGVARRLNNNGVVLEDVLGDGRHLMPIQASTPGSLAAGQYFLVTIAGIDYFGFVDSSGTLQLVTPGGGALVGTTPLVNGVSVTVDTVANTGAVKWLVDIVDGSGSHLAFEVLSAPTGVATNDYTVYTATSPLPHAVAVDRTASTTTLNITASGAGFSATARRIQL